MSSETEQCSLQLNAQEMGIIGLVNGHFLQEVLRILPVEMETDVGTVDQWK